MKKVLLVMVAGMGCILAEDVSKKEEAPKLVLSEVENLKLENLKLKTANLTQEIQNLQQQVMQAKAKLEQETREFVEKTLKDHGNPDAFEWDAQKLEFRAKVPKPEKK